MQARTAPGTSWLKGICMTRKSLLRGSLAVLGLFALQQQTGRSLLQLVTPAEADVDVSVSIGTFYDDLAPHGSWTRYDDRYVFIPANVGPGWRPYTAGRWVYTDRYGWMWVSDEPFGWATYHYGRWGFEEDIGWFWVPGSRWAPAWVSWRRSDDYYAWAPLPYRQNVNYFDDDVNISINIGDNDIPDYYWAAVPAPSFLSVNLATVIIRDDDERRRIIRRAERRGAVRFRDNRIVNNVIDVDIVERDTRRRVRRARVVEADRPDRVGRRGDDEVAVFNRRVTREENARPRNARELREVREERRQRRQQNAQYNEQPQQGDEQNRVLDQDQNNLTREQQRQQNQNARQRDQQDDNATEQQNRNQNERTRQQRQRRQERQRQENNRNTRQRNQDDDPEVVTPRQRRQQERKQQRSRANEEQQEQPRGERRRRNQNARPRNQRNRQEENRRQQRRQRDNAQERRQRNNGGQQRQQRQQQQRGCDPNVENCGQQQRRRQQN
jgi:hypothetical protein